MKRHIIILGILFSSIANAQSKKEQQVAAAVEQLKNAMISGIANELEKIVSDQLSYGHSSGAVDDMKIFIEKLSSGKSDFISIDLTNQSISISGKTAVVRHVLDAKTNDGGKSGEVKLKVLLIWQKLGGQWKLLARQAVKPS